MERFAERSRGAVKTASRPLTNAAAILTFVLLVPLAGTAYAQAAAPREQAWILYEQGRALQEDKAEPEPGRALYLYRRAIERAGVFPEAEMAIGEIYLQEGAYALAEEQFRTALEHSAAFLIPEQKYLVRYRLVELYDLQNRYADLERQLMAIVQDQPQYAGTGTQRLTEAIQDTYRDHGLDRVLVLYRMTRSTFAVAAHARLGWVRYRSGMFAPASITHSLFALNIVVTEAVEEIRRSVPSFEYTTLASFVRAAASRPAVRSYLIESGFFRVLYYLAAATYAAQRPGTARELWTVLARVEPELAGEYAELSRRQLRQPWIEPRIIELPTR